MKILRAAVIAGAASFALSAGVASAAPTITDLTLSSGSFSFQGVSYAITATDAYGHAVAVTEAYWYSGAITQIAAGTTGTHASDYTSQLANVLSPVTGYSDADGDGNPFATTKAGDFVGGCVVAGTGIHCANGTDVGYGHESTGMSLSIDDHMSNTGADTGRDVNIASIGTPGFDQLAFFLVQDEDPVLYINLAAPAVSINLSMADNNGSGTANYDVTGVDAFWPVEPAPAPGALLLLGSGLVGLGAARRRKA